MGACDVSRDVGMRQLLDFSFGVLILCGPVLTALLLPYFLPDFPAPAASPNPAARQPSRLHAIIVAAGGQSDDNNVGPPLHVEARVVRAAEMYHAQSKSKPIIITTAAGTPHKPSPRDVA